MIKHTPCARRVAHAKGLGVFAGNATREVELRVEPRHASTVALKPQAMKRGRHPDVSGTSRYIPLSRTPWTNEPKAC